MPGMDGVIHPRAIGHAASLMHHYAVKQAEMQDPKWPCLRPCNESSRASVLKAIGILTRIQIVGFSARNASSDRFVY